MQKLYKIRAINFSPIQIQERDYQKKFVLKKYCTDKQLGFSQRT